MSDHGWDSGDMFPHDGEFGDMCTGFGCDCDERHYGDVNLGGCSRLILTPLVVPILLLLGFIPGIGPILFWLVLILWIMCC